MTTAEHIPLWNWYGTRRHIADPERLGTHRESGEREWTLCGQIHNTRMSFVTRYRVSDHKLDTAPLCQKCAKKAGMGLPKTVTLTWGEIPPWMERHGSWFEGKSVQAWTPDEGHDDASEVTPMYRLVGREGQ